MGLVRRAMQRSGMRIFVKYTKTGEVVSVSKVATMPEGLEHPYSELGNNELVLELSGAAAQAELDPIVLHEQYKVDPDKKKLIKKR
jgi:hypothetical protein